MVTPEPLLSVSEGFKIAHQGQPAWLTSLIQPFSHPPTFPRTRQSHRSPSLSRHVQVPHTLCTRCPPGLSSGWEMRLASPFSALPSHEPLGPGGVHDIGQHFHAAPLKSHGPSSEGLRATRQAGAMPSRSSLPHPLVHSLSCVCPGLPGV